MKFTLRDYQDSAVADVRLAFRIGHKAVLLVLCTGAGKTVIFSYIACSAVERGRKVLILAHRDQLIKQASRKLRDYNLKHGIIMAGFTPDHNAKAQVGSVQTLARRLTKIRFMPDLIIIDEAHLSAAASYRAILDHYPDAVVLGVTGSPCRLDNKPLGREFGGIYDYMVQGISIRQLIDRGFLVQPKVFAPAEQLDLSGVKKSKGDYDTQELAAVVDKPKITGSAVAHYKRICPDAPAVAWCVTVEHAQHVADEFNAAGVPAVMLCGEHESSERDAALHKLTAGEIKVITFVGILIEGVDCPAIQAVILLRPTMSLASYLQVIGRALRTLYLDGLPLGTDAERLAAIAASYKTCAYVLDHAGLSFKHGLADEEREWDLNGEVKKKGKKKAKEDKVDLIQCLGKNCCYGVFAPTEATKDPETQALACPHCGKPLEVKTRKIEHAEGELREITPEMADAMRRTKRKEVQGAKTLEDLQRIAAQRGYSPGWAKHAFEARQRTKGKYRPQRPKAPSIEELKVMPLAELENVANAQGWPPTWASEFYRSQGAGADLFTHQHEA